MKRRGTVIDQIQASILSLMLWSMVLWHAITWHLLDSTGTSFTPIPYSKCTPCHNDSKACDDYDLENIFVDVPPTLIYAVNPGVREEEESVARRKKPGRKPV